MLLRIAVTAVAVLALTACGGSKKQAAPRSTLPPGCKGGGTIDCAHQKVAAWVTKGP